MGDKNFSESSSTSSFEAAIDIVSNLDVRRTLANLDISQLAVSKSFISIYLYSEYTNDNDDNDVTTSFSNLVFVCYQILTLFSLQFPLFGMMYTVQHREKISRKRFFAYFVK